MKHHLIRIGKPFWYLLMLFLIVLGTVALVAYGQGYIFNPRTGEITGGGLLLLDSRPGNARIWVNGDESSTTPRRLRLPAGSHEVQMYREGYRGWDKVFSIRQGRVVDAEYPVLIPDEITVQAVEGVSDPALLSTSFNQRHVAIASSQRRPQISLLSAGSSTAETLYRLPSGYAGYEVVSLDWSLNDGQLLVGADGENSPAYFVIEIRGDQNSSDLDQIFEMDFERVEFGRDGEIYGLSDGGLYSLNLSDGTTELVASSVVGWTTSGDGIYLLQTGRQGATSILRVSGGAQEVLRVINRKGNYELQYSDYDDEPVLILHDKSRQQVSLLRLSGASVKTESLAPRMADSVSLSPGGRFLTTSSEVYFTTYDFNTGLSYSFVMDHLPDSHFDWYGTHHLLFVSGGNVFLTEFDGANGQLITPAVSLQVTSSLRSRSVFSIGSDSDGSYTLQESSLE